MKKSYITPQTCITPLDMQDGILAVVSGGAKGNSGDKAEAREEEEYGLNPFGFSLFGDAWDEE